MFLKPEYEISFPMLLATSIASDPCSSCANMLIGKRLRSVQVYQKSYMQLRPKTYQLVGCVSVSAHMLLSSVYCMRCICIDITGVVLVVSESDCFFSLVVVWDKLRKGLVLLVFFILCWLTTISISSGNMSVSHGHIFLIYYLFSSRTSYSAEHHILGSKKSVQAYC